MLFCFVFSGVCPPLVNLLICIRMLFWSLPLGTFIQKGSCSILEATVKHPERTGAPQPWPAGSSGSPARASWFPGLSQPGSPGSASFHSQAPHSYDSSSTVRKLKFLRPS